MLAALLNAVQAHRQATSRTCACWSSASAPRASRSTKILLQAGVTDVVGCDSQGRRLHTERADYLDGSMPRSSAGSPRPPTPSSRTARPADVIDGADLFIGLSGARVMPAEALARMNDDAMVFAMANPNPEVTPEEAAPYARDRSPPAARDYPNQINNVLCFPGIFRGALDVRARAITEEMKMAAARGDRRDRRRRRAARGLHHPVGLQPRRRAAVVAAAVAEQARKAEGSAQVAGNTIGFAALDAERMRAG